MPNVVITGGRGDLAQALIFAFSHDLETSWKISAPGRDQLDVRSATSVQEWFGNLDAIHVLIASAGVSKDGLLSTVSASDLDHAVSVNLTGAFRCVQAALPLMLRAGGGHIVLIGSRTGRAGAAGQTVYSATKAALHGLATSIAKEYGAQNIRCNVVLPGFLQTKMTASVKEKRLEQVRAQLTLGRMNTPENAARFIAFLATLDHVSGQVFTLDSRIDSWI